MRIALYTRYNGFGLQADAEVVGGVLKTLGHEVVFSEPEDPLKADVSFHFEIPSIQGVRLSKRSFFYPNFEWMLANLASMRRFTEVLCKTQHALPKAKRYAQRATFTSFTSADMYRGGSKALECYHFRGNSDAKNSDLVLETWEENPDLPHLHLYSVKPMQTKARNVSLYIGYASREELVRVMNRCMIAVYPSAVEGFGQALWESLSAGSILVTADAPPMNEIEVAYKVPAWDSGKRMRGEPLHAFAKENLAYWVREISHKRPSWIAEKAVASRMYWSRNHNSFVRKLVELLENHSVP